jgi:hypothetical protein
MPRTLMGLAENLLLAGLLEHFSYKYVAVISRRKHYRPEKKRNCFKGKLKGNILHSTMN